MNIRLAEKSFLKNSFTLLAASFWLLATSFWLRALILTITKRAGFDRTVEGTSYFLSQK